MLKKLFKSKKESQLLLKKELFEIEIEKLKNEIRKKDGFLKCKNSLFTETENKKKQEKNWQEIEEQLKKYHKENNDLRDSLKEIERILPILPLKFNYLIPIEKYLYEVKFKEVVEILRNKGNKFVQNLNEYIVDNLSIEDEIKIYLKNKIKKFENLEINWNLKTHLLKGEKLSKIYSKHRKFTNMMLSENREFISNLDEYNFDALINKGYSLEEIKELKEIYQNYTLKYRIENL
ncbi:MAG: hypothetical protein ACRDBY_01390 [Cetobacterium sp.]